VSASRPAANAQGAAAEPPAYSHARALGRLALSCWRGTADIHHTIGGRDLDAERRGSHSASRPAAGLGPDGASARGGCHQLRLSCSDWRRRPAAPDPRGSGAPWDGEGAPRKRSLQRSQPLSRQARRTARRLVLRAAHPQAGLAVARPACFRIVGPERGPRCGCHMHLASHV